LVRQPILEKGLKIIQQTSYRDYLFLDKVNKVGYIKTDSEIEALILEANLIKKLSAKIQCHLER
jgi:excinuclease UvrABC nuclease subunit